MHDRCRAVFLERGGVPRFSATRRSSARTKRRVENTCGPDFLRWSSAAPAVSLAWGDFADLLHPLLHSGPRPPVGSNAYDASAFRHLRFIGEAHFFVVSSLRFSAHRYLNALLAGKRDFDVFPFAGLAHCGKRAFRIFRRWRRACGARIGRHDPFCVRLGVLLGFGWRVGAKLQAEVG